MRKVIVICLSMLAFMISCTSIDCSMNSTVLCAYRFMNAQGDSVALSDTLSVISSRSIDGNDTVLVNRMTKVCTMRLPMSYAQNADELRLVVTNSYGEQMSDYVVVSKTDEPLFESVDCAPRYNHTISDISTTRNFIDSVVVNNKKVTNDPTTINVLIYLRTSD